MCIIVLSTHSRPLVYSRTRSMWQGSVSVIERMLDHVHIYSYCHAKCRLIFAFYCKPTRPLKMLKKGLSELWDISLFTLVMNSKRQSKQELETGWSGTPEPHMKWGGGLNRSIKGSTAVMVGYTSKYSCPHRKLSLKDNNFAILHPSSVPVGIFWN